jgi:apurinic endonuclease APN1
MKITRKNTKRIPKNQTKKITSKKLFKKLILGCHISISSSSSTFSPLLDSIKYLESIDGNAAQIFLGSNRSASLKTKTKLTDEEITQIRNYLSQNKITLIIHSIYLLNFCNAPPNSGRVKYMHDNIQYDLEYGSRIGAKCVILHLGFKKDLEATIAIKNLIDNINKILKEMPPRIKLALETPAGQGSQIAYTLEELTLIWNGVKHFGYKKVGICIDTAHIFVSGYDISSVSGIKDYLDKFNTLIGWKNITNFHINDSRYPIASRKDEHRSIGQGLIYHTPEGKKALKYIKIFCETRGIPMILETPNKWVLPLRHSVLAETPNKWVLPLRHSPGSADIEDSHKAEHGYKWEIEMIRKL